MNDASWLEWYQSLIVVVWGTLVWMMVAIWPGALPRYCNSRSRG
jgi:hypothetical protein